MNFLSAEQDELDLQFTQMGASVQSLHGLLCFIRFMIGDIELFYVYNINAKDQYYLQRVKPYPVGAGLFKDPSEIVEYIKNDKRQFENAYKSKDFGKFTEINMKLHHTIHNMEDLFIEYNVPVEKMLQIEEKLKEIDDIMEEARKTSPKVEL